MKTRRFLSLVMSLVMIVGTLCLPQISLAYDNSETVPSNGRAKVSFYYLGKAETAFGMLTVNGVTLMDGASINDLIAQGEGEIGDIKQGDTIWIGVKLSDMENIRDLLKPEEVLTKEGGIGYLQFGMTYDADYLTPLEDSDFVLGSYGPIEFSYPQAKNALGRDTDTYAGALSLDQPVIKGGSAEDVLLTGSNLKALYETIQFNDSTSTENDTNIKYPRLYQNDVTYVDNKTPTDSGNFDSSDKIVGAFGFTVNKVPEKGAKVLQAALSGPQFGVGIGFNRKSPGLVWDKDRSAAAGTGNAKNYFDLVDAEENPTDPIVNIFPSKYEVRYYNNDTDAEAAYAVGSADDSEITKVPGEGEADLTDNSTVTLPDISKFTNADPKKVISGFKFVDKRDPGVGDDGVTPNDPFDNTFDETTTMKSCYCDSNNIIYVYPEWVDGTKVEFNTNFDNNTVDGKTVADDATFDEYIYIPEDATTATVSDENVKKDANFIVAGYALKDWYYDAEKTQVADLTDLDPSKAGTLPGEIKLYAKWSKNWYVKFYNNNGATEPDPIPTIEIDANSTIDAASKTGDIPTPTAPTGYKFDSWNTAANGSGTKYADATAVGAADFTSVVDTNSNVELYAQWVPDDGTDSVVIAFDKNNADDSGATEPNPPSVTIKLGDALGTKMPNDPARTNYTFEGWNTQADGKGTKVDNTTEIKNTDDITLEGTESPYDLTLYAQWKLDETKVPNPDDQVTLTFYKNENGKLGTDTTDVYASYKIKKGDALGFVPGPVTNSEHPNSAAFTDWSKNGKADGTVFDDGTAAIDVDATYHAAWALTVIYGVYDDAQTDDMNPAAKYLYTGAEIKPAYIIYEQGAAAGTVGTVIVGATGDTLADSADFAMTYYKTSDTTEAPIALRNVLTDPETYTPKLAAKADGAYDGFELVPTSKSVISIVNSNPDAPEGEPNKTTLTPVIDTTKQSWKVKDTVVSPLARVEGLVGDDITTVGADTTVSNAVYDVNYYTFVDANGDGNADDGELTATTLADIITKSATDEGKYVIKIELKGDYVNNYTLEAADALSSDGTVAVYTGAGVAPGQNMKLEVAKGKPWITDLKVTSDIVGVYPDNTYTEADKIGGKGYSILTSATEPTPDEGSILAEDYAVRGGSDQTEVKINIKLSEDIPEADIADRVVVTGGKAGEEPTFTKEEDGTWTITVPLGSNDPTKPDTITITTKESDGNDAFAYEFEVQTLKALPTIAFKPGNSPFGLIERMSTENGGSWDADKVAAAKQAFIDSNDGYGTLKYGEGNVPDNAETNVGYTVAAWRSYNADYDPENPDMEQSLAVNYDLDEDALFVYAGYTFEDPGITLYDQAGNEVTITASNVTKTLEVDVLGAEGIPKYSDADAITPTQLTETSYTSQDGTQTSNNCYVFNRISVRPDKYEITYTLTYNDLMTGEANKTIEYKRPVIVLSERGDVSISDRYEVTSLDLNGFRNEWSRFESRNSLYSFRISDVAHVDRAELSSSDLNTYRNSWSKGYTNFYNVDVLNGIRFSY